MPGAYGPMFIGMVGDAQLRQASRVMVPLSRGFWSSLYVSAKLGGNRTPDHFGLGSAQLHVLSSKEFPFTPFEINPK